MAISPLFVARKLKCKKPNYKQAGDNVYVLSKFRDNVWKKSEAEE